MLRVLDRNELFPEKVLLHRFPSYFVFVSKQLRNKPRIFKTLLAFDLASLTIINSKRVRLQCYLFVCLSLLNSDAFLSSLDFVNNSHSP